MNEKSPKTIAYLRVSTIDQDIEKNKADILSISAVIWACSKVIFLLHAFIIITGIAGKIITSSDDLNIISGDMSPLNTEQPD